MKVKIYEKNWNISDIECQKDKLFVYADNYMRIGKKGQAVIRDAENSVGLATKKSPNTRDTAYLNDRDLEENKKRIDEDILTIKFRSLNENRIIILSSNCYGNDLAMMPEKCPITYEYLNMVMLNNFNFDNLTGKKINKIPGYNQIRNAKYVHISKENKDILTVPNNSYFIKSYLENGLISNYDLILSGKKIAFTHKSDLIFNPNDILIFKFDNIINYLVVRVMQSYDVENITKEQWSIFEGITTDFELNNDNYIQTHFDYICILDSNNNMILPGDLFPTTIPNKEEIIEEKESIEEIIEEIIEEKESIEETIETEYKEENNKLEMEKEEKVLDESNKILNDIESKKTKEDLIIELLTDIKKELSHNKSFWQKLFGK